MLIVTGSVSIKAPVMTCFEAIAQPTLWPCFNPFCRSVEILSQEGNITRFVFCHVSGDRWCSSQFASPEGRFCFVERLDPSAPMAYFQYVRSVQSAPDASSVLLEEVRIEFGSADSRFEEDAVRRVQSHMSIVQRQFKEYLEEHANRAI